MQNRCFGQQGGRLAANQMDDEEQTTILCRKIPVVSESKYTEAEVDFEEYGCSLR
jgi:hypothetical protein